MIGSQKTTCLEDDMGCLSGKTKESAALVFVLKSRSQFQPLNIQKTNGSSFYLHTRIKFYNLLQ